MIGSIFSGVGSLIDSGYNIYSSNKNYELQKENMQWQRDFNERQFAYQQNLNKQIMQREDTAVQRRANDLKSAGMSKWLAAGQGASTSVLGSAGSSNAQAPASAPMLNLQQGINGALSVYGAIANARNTEANTAQALAQADLIRTNILTEINYRRSQIEASTELTKQQKENLLKEYERLSYDLERSRDQGLRTNDQLNSIFNSATSVYETATRYPRELGKSVSKAVARKVVDLIKGIFN